jgi:hypothetical protein
MGIGEMAKRTSRLHFINVTDQTDKPKFRDKGNTAPRPTPPSFVRYPAPNMAPSGMMGIRAQAVPRQEQQEPSPQTQPFNRANDNGDDQTLWTEGHIFTMDGYTFNAQLSDEPTFLGIDGGKITALDVRKHGLTVMRYDQGWQVDPKTIEHKEALHRIRNGLDDAPSKNFKGFDRSPNKGHGFER